MISVRTLGPADVHVDGDDMPSALRWQKHLGLLVYLAHSPKRTRSREHLIGLLWPDKDDKAARHSLREALRSIRQHLGDAGLDTSGAAVRLTNDQVQLDTTQLESLTEEDRWLDAAELIGGEFMEGFAIPGATDFEDWLTTERRIWQQRSVDVLVQAAREELNTGRPDHAQQYAQRAMHLDPTSDVAVQMLIQIAALEGNRAGALNAYDTFAARLEEQLGLEPSEETTGLVHRIRDDPAWGLGDRVVQTDAGPSRRPPLIGRERELKAMLRHWKTCRTQSRATVLLLEADSGLGKTRLADELLARTRLEGAVTSTVRSVDGDRAETWSGLTGLLRGGLADATGLAAAPTAALAGLIALAPEWSDQFGPAVRTADPLPPARAVCEVLRAVSEEQPVALLFDDAQYLDPSTAGALESILRDLTDRPICITVCIVPHDDSLPIDNIRTRIGRDFNGKVTRLEPLAPAAGLELTHWAFPDLADERLDRMTRRVMNDSAGIPLLAVELLHAVALGLELAEEGDRAWPNTGQTLDQTRPGDLPDPIIAAIRIGFRRLSEPAQRILQVAAVLGTRVTPGQLGEKTELDSSELDRGLDELEWQRWLSAEPRGYSFVARIVREVVNRDMVTSRQRRQMLGADSVL